MQTREEWLVAAAEKICVWFNQHKVELEPNDYKITCGWPSRSATDRLLAEQSKGGEA